MNKILDKSMTGLSGIKEKAKRLHLSNLRNNLEEILKESEAEDMGNVAFLDYVLDLEMECRANTAKNKRIRQAGFSQIKTLEDYDTGFLKGFNKNKLDRLAGLEWINEHYNLIFTGTPGTGKSHLACALTYKAAQEGYVVSMLTFDELIRLLKTADFDNRSSKRIKVIKKSQVICIDDFGYISVGRKEAGAFFHLLCEMSNRCSFIITTIKPASKLVESFENQDIALSILDRLIEKCDILELVGESYRMEHRQTFLG